MRKVFLSSTAKDLAPYRAAVVEALRKIDRVDVQWMVDWVSQDASSLQLCEDRVRGADLFVGLIGHCFGTAPPEVPQRSYTMLEWDWACDAGLPRLMHLAPSSFSMPHDVMAAETPEGQALQRAFREQDLAGTHAGQPDAWQNPDRLATHVVIAVSQKLAEMEADTQPGFSKAGLEADLYRRLLELTEERERTAEDRATLDQEKAAVEAKLADLDQSYAQAQETIAGLEADLARYGNTLDPAIRDAAEQAIDAGDFDAAERAYAQITDHGEMEIKRTAAAYFQRGKIAEEQIRWQDARRHYDRTVELDPNTDNMNAAAQTAAGLGDFGSAEAIARTGLNKAKDEEALEDVGLWLASCGAYIGRQGRFEEAEMFLRDALEPTERAYGKDHLNYAALLANLGGLLNAQGNKEAAEHLIRDAIEIIEASAGDRHPFYAKGLQNLASLLVDLARHQEAVEIVQGSIDSTRDTLGERHPVYAAQLHTLSVALISMGRHVDALLPMRQQFQILVHALGRDHPDTVIGARGYAKLLREHFPDDPALAELQDTFGKDIGLD
ncbi:MAG: tetratricopeptide repeat protein [Pseudomonadota bacterium]